MCVRVVAAVRAAGERELLELFGRAKRLLAKEKEKNSESERKTWFVNGEVQLSPVAECEFEQYG